MESEEKPATDETPAKVEVLPADAVALFRSLLDKDYYAALKDRLKAGIAGPVEILVLKYAHGEPKNHHRVKDDQARFKKLVEEMKKLRTEDPERANFLDAQVQALGAVDVPEVEEDASE